MILSDAGIRQELTAGGIVIDPAPEPDQFQTSAVDMFLGASFRVWDLARLASTRGFTPVLDLSEQQFAQTANSFSMDADLERDGSYVLKPYREVPQVLLCQTRERIHLTPQSRLAARVEGRSSLARLGLMVHLTAPTIHAGFNGNITLEVINHGPFHLRLVPFRTRICQFISSASKRRQKLRSTHGSRDSARQSARSGRLSAGRLDRVVRLPIPSQLGESCTPEALQRRASTAWCPRKPSASTNATR
jgi:dCTP deaminase